MGVFHLSVALPASVAGGSTLSLRAIVSGVGDVGTPLTATVQLQFLFDPAAGSNRSISKDGTTLTYTDAGQFFRGRTALLRCGTGVSLDVGVEVQGHGNTFTVALGRTDHIAGRTYDYSCNSGLAFFLDLYHGAVNQVWGTSEPGRPRLQSPRTCALHFRIRGTTLTFRAGDSVKTLKDQAGSWQLPAELYLLFAGYAMGCVVRLFPMA
jgi:hypothetical protein